MWSRPGNRSCSDISLGPSRSAAVEGSRSRRRGAVAPWRRGAVAPWRRHGIPASVCRAVARVAGGRLDDGPGGGHCGDQRNQRVIRYRLHEARVSVHEGAQGDSFPDQCGEGLRQHAGSAPGLAVRQRQAGDSPHLDCRFAMPTPHAPSPWIEPSLHRAEPFSARGGSAYAGRADPHRRLQTLLRLRGAGWHFGQRELERFMKCSRTIGVPQRRHGRPACPYAASDRSK